MGIVMHDAGKNLKTPGFRTRSYLSHPVSDRNSWLKMKSRYNGADEARYPRDWTGTALQLESKDAPVFQPGVEYPTARKGAVDTEIIGKLLFWVEIRPSCAFRHIPWDIFDYHDNVHCTLAFWAD